MNNLSHQVMLMSFNKVSAGRDIPNDVNVIIEIPAFSDPVKYEVDKFTGLLTVDRFMGTAMQYPTNYGYIPHTLSEDGDPVDVLVMSPAPLLSGCVVRCRPIGILKMVDEAGNDGKILALPVHQLTPFYDRIESFEQITEGKLEKITHFFQHYKDLEPGKWVRIDGWFGVDDAKQEILQSIERYQDLRTL